MLRWLKDTSENGGDFPPEELAREPPPGFEPGTYALRVRCSTPELKRQLLLSLKLI